MQVFYGRIAKFIEVMRQYFGRKPHGNTFHTLCQQQGEFDGQRHRFLVSSVVRQFPFGCFGVEHHIECKFGKACFDVTGGGCAVSCKNIPPVSLAVDEQILLAELHQCVTDAGITVRVKLHGVSHDVCHLVIASVFHTPHGVQDTPLHGFQSVHDVGYGTFQDYVRGIIQEPVLIHAAQLVLDVCIIGIRRFIIRMPFAPLREFFIQIIFCSFKVFAHICSGVVYS